MSISVIIPSYNEQETLESIVQEVISILEKAEQLYEVVVVDDGSTDATGDIADLLAKRNKHVTAVHHQENRGLGGVYRTAFSTVKYDWVTYIPGDGEIPACTIQTFMSVMDDMDMVLGFLPAGKYLPDGSPDLRSRTLSGIERMLYRILFGGFPKFQGNLMWRRTLLEEFNLRSTGRGWMVMIELIIRASRAGCKMTSVPIEMRPRVAGRSKVKTVRMGIIMLREILSLWICMSLKG